MRSSRGEEKRGQWCKIWVVCSSTYVHTFMGWLKMWTLKISYSQDLFFKYFPLRKRNADWNLESEKHRWKVQRPEVVELMAKAGTGCLCFLQGSWSSLLEGQLESWGMDRAGVSLAVQTLHGRDWRAEQARWAFPCALPTEFIFIIHTTGIQWLKCGTFWCQCLWHQSRLSGGIRADLILSSHQYWHACQTGLEMQSWSCSDMLKTENRNIFNGLDESVGYSSMSKEMWFHKFSLKVDDPVVLWRGNMHRSVLLIFSPLSLPCWTCGCCVPK